MTNILKDRSIAPPRDTRTSLPEKKQLAATTGACSHWKTLVASGFCARSGCHSVMKAYEKL